MTAPSATAAVGPMPSAVPYPPSALDRLYARMERLPAGGWWVYGLMFAAMVAYHHVALWATGSRPLGSRRVVSGCARPGRTTPSRRR